MLSHVDASPALPARLEVGAFEQEIEAFDPLSLVEDIAEQLGPRAREKFLALMVFVAPEIPRRLCGSPAGLAQVLHSLLDNAIKFTEKGQIIARTWIERPGEQAVTLCCQVADTGVGIPAAALERLRQGAIGGDPARIIPAGGGAGMIIARDLAIKMGGTFEVTETSSRGTTVSFSVPLTSAAAPASSADAATGLRPQPLRVLVVDDNQTHREILLRYLSYWGIQSSSASGGEEALALLHQAAAAEDPYRMAILDLAMPGMDGFALAHTIRRDPGLGAMDLILLTAFDERGQGEMALREGFAAYLTKPVKHAHLLSTIQAVIGKADRPVASPA